jgi:HD-like signal output (HDOD) protein
MIESDVPKIVRDIPLLASLPPWQLEVIADAVESVSARKGMTIVERGTDDGYTYFLTDGKVALEAADGHDKVIEITADTSQAPVANLRPRIITVKALSKVNGVRVPDIVLSAAGCRATAFAPEAIRVESEEEQERRQLESKLSFQLYRDLKSDAAILPSLPDLAMRIRKAIDDDMSDAREIARLVETDPAMATKLLKVANSAFYAGTAEVESLPKAVVRLGMKTTRQLVMSFALRDLFRNKNPEIQKRMVVLWKHSAQIAALSFVLAREVRRIDPEEALLVGLVHDVGTIAILNYIEKYPALAEYPAALEETIEHMRGELGAMILREWKFAPALIAASRDAELWERQHAGEADFTDLLIVAQALEKVRKQQSQGLPPIERMSAFRRVLGDDAGPEKSLKILHDAKAQVDEMRSLLRD